MATYKVVCTERLYTHRHLTHVGTGPGSSADTRWTVAEVRSSLRAGNRFFTEDPATGKTADVEPYDARVNGEVIYTIRSSPDATRGNNLDFLRVCRWNS